MSEIKRLCEEVEDLRTQLAACQRELEEARKVQLRHERGESWFWQGDGWDFPESLNCPVIMQADKLQGLFKRAESAEQQLVEEVAMRDKWINYAFVGAVVPPLPNGRAKELPTAIESLQQQLQQMKEAEAGREQRELELMKGAITHAYSSFHADKLLIQILDEFQEHVKREQFAVRALLSGTSAPEVKA